MKRFDLTEKQTIALDALKDKPTAFIMMDRRDGLTTFLLRYAISQTVLGKTCLYVGHSFEALHFYKSYLEEIADDTNFTFKSIRSLVEGRSARADLLILDNIYPNQINSEAWLKPNGQLIYGVTSEANFFVNLASPYPEAIKKYERRRGIS